MNISPMKGIDMIHSSLTLKCFCEEALKRIHEIHPFLVCILEEGEHTNTPATEIQNGKREI